MGVRRSTAFGILALVVAFFLGGLNQVARSQTQFDSGRAAFAVGFNNEVYPYRQFASFVLPGERIIVRIIDDRDSTFEVSASAGSLERTDSRRYVWIAPQAPGRADIAIREAAGETIRVTALIQVPATRVRNGVLNGYEIGRYPRPPIDDAMYAVPDGFIEVQETDLALQVSPHFVLGQFVSDRSPAFPKYIVLRERLLLKLETLLERVNQTYPAESFGILSGYRTPARNAAVGGSPHSRHIYGGAAAIVIDRDPVDGVMDDINGDGDVTRADAELLFRITDTLFREPELRYLQGGLAVYGPTAWRGPYLHIDARGFRARWDGDQDLQRLVNPTQPRHPRNLRPR